MDYPSWVRALDARGLTVVPPSHPVPVDLWALLPGGGALHFRCRGTGVTLDRYAEDALIVTSPPALCDCGCGARLAPPAQAGRFGVRSGSVPLRTIRYDGRRLRGWHAHEAGLLSIDAAAALFDELLDRLLDGPSKGVSDQRAGGLSDGRSGGLSGVGGGQLVGPVATGRSGSLVQSDHEPT